MNDPVNNPSHYNQNGIEVIEVIETYAKDDFRLANVIKYVCRSGYKGNKLQDLRKAYWYLARVIEELETAEFVEECADEFANYVPPTPEEFVEQLKRGAQAMLDAGEEPETGQLVDDAVFLNLPFDGRVAGQCDTPIYDEYYEYNGDEVITYCRHPMCQSPIRRSDLYVQCPKGRDYCSTRCVDLHLAGIALGSK